MGSVEPVSLWTTEDDLLLKNAVEAGASLEALARGAVQFSRRYSLEELTERWRSMLYDKDTSEVVSARILDLEFSSPGVYKSGKALSFRGKDSSNSKKREIPSVRSHYYAMRKRICSDPRPNGGRGFGAFQLPTEDNSCGIHLKDGCADVKIAQPGDLLGSACPTLASTDHYPLPSVTGFDVAQGVFPDLLGDGVDIIAGASQGFDMSHLDTDAVENDRAVQTTQTEQIRERYPPDGICGRDGMYEHDIGSMFLDKQVSNNAYRQVEESKEFVFEGNKRFRSCSTEEVCPPETLYQINSSEQNNATNISSNQQEKTSMDYVVAQNVKTEVALEYPSSVQETAFWGRGNEPCMPSLPVDKGFEAKEQETYVSSEIIEGSQNLESQGCTGGPFEPLPCHSGDADTDFMDISLEFTNEDEQFFEDSLIDTSHLDGLSNFLMSSPIEVHQDDGQNKEATSLDAGQVLHYPFAQEYPKSEDGNMFSGHGDGTFEVVPEAQLPDMSSTFSCCYEPLQGPVYCPLNTEVQEIPNNDDIILPLIASLAAAKDDAGLNSTDICPPTNDSLTIMNSSSPKLEKDEQQTPRPHIPSSPKFEEQTTPELGLVQHIHSQTSEIPSNVPLSGAPRNSGKECLKDSVISPAPPASTTGTVLKEAIRSPDAAECGVFGQTQPVSTSDQEEKYFDAEEEVPSVSDVEAMILDMDLLPYDEEPSFYANDASTYRSQEYKKKMMRWEQSFRSCTQRAIASHGALALFYGRRLKYYLKKPQVLIGRATGEVDVDIDLRIEGCANKISRRQAVIVMDAEGCFHLKNLGKFPITINGQEVDQDKCCRLSSGCCIEIRGLSFLFEVNKKSVKRHLSSTSKVDNKTHNSEYGWLAGEKF